MLARPAHCSGLMYAGVPMSVPVRVLAFVDDVVVSLAMPKSRILTKSSSPLRGTRNRLSGLRSRWMIPLAWLAARPEQHCEQDVPHFLEGQPRRLVEPRRQALALEQLHHEVDDLAAAFLLDLLRSR